MLHLLERFGGFFPAVVALLLPILFIPTLGDLYILPRASIVIAGACIGAGLAILSPARGALGVLRWPLVAAAAAGLLAFAFSISWPLSLAGSYTRYESLPMRLGYLGLLASSVWLLRTERQRAVLVAAFIFGSSVAALEAIQQAFGHVSFRPDGNLGNANLLAALLVMAIPLAVERALHANWNIAAWSAAMVVMAGGLLATTSRSGFLAVGVAGLVLVTLLVPSRFVGIAAAVSAVLSVLALAVLYASPLRTLNGDPPELRLHLWQDGLHMIAARPITGWGEDTTGIAFGHFLSQDYASLVTFDRIHSGPLDVAATQGLLGLAATGLVVALVFVHAWRNRSHPGVAGLAAALAGYTVWVAFNFDWSPATGMFWLLAGALWSASLPHSPGQVAGEAGQVGDSPPRSPGAAPLRGTEGVGPSLAQSPDEAEQVGASPPRSPEAAPLRGTEGVGPSLAQSPDEAEQVGASPPRSPGAAPLRGTEGVGPSLPRSPGKVAPREAPGRMGLNILQPTLAVALVGAAIVIAVLPVLADSWYVKGRPDLSVKVDPLQAQYHWAYGTLPELRRAAELGETDPGLYVTLGDAELRAGNRTAATRAFERALEIDPYYSPAAQRLAALGA